MKKILNQLIQLQELYFALEEHRVSGQRNQLEQLEEAIQAQLRLLPQETAYLFQKLHHRDPPAIAPASNRICLGCGVTVSTSMGAELLHMDALYQCPNCLRFLYPYQGEKLDFPTPSLYHKLPRLGITKFSSEKLMIPQLKGENTEEVIQELAYLISDQLFFNNAQLLIDKALERENITSTAVEHSLAFPHVRGLDAGGLTLALGIKKKGIKFGAPRNRLTRIFFFIIIPTAATAFYLKLLAGLIETFSASEAREKLLESATPEELWSNLQKLTRKTIP